MSETAPSRAAIARKRKRNMARLQRRKHNRILTLAAILLVVLFFLINLVTKDREFSDAENRSLQQRPKLSVETLKDGSWCKDTLSHYSDQMFGRDGWISLNLTADRMLGRKDENGVMLGKDGYLAAYPNDTVPETVEAVTSAISSFGAAHPDYRQYVLMIPTASQIMGEYLPKNAPISNQLADISDFYSRVSGAAVCIDAEPVLSNHAGEYIFYKTDHHWTSLGAYYTFSAAASQLGIEAPVSSYNVYTVSTDFQGTLASKSGSHRATDSVTVYSPVTEQALEYYVYNPNTDTKTCSIYDSSALETKNKYNVFFGDNYPLLEIKTTANNDRILMIFKDSYANSFVQFLLPYYEKIIMIDPRYYTDNLGAYLNSAGVTDVLYLFTADTLLTDPSTAEVLGSAS